MKLHSIIYYLFPLICLLFLVDAFDGPLAALLPLIWRSASACSLLRPTSSAGLSPTHLLALVEGELRILFFSFFSLPLSRNDSTVRCYEGWVLMSWLCNAGGRCSGTEGESEDGAVGDALADGGAEGPLWPCHEGVRRTQLQQPDRQSCVPTNGGYLVKLHSFKMQNQPCSSFFLVSCCSFLILFCLFLGFF